MRFDNWNGHGLQIRTIGNYFIFFSYHINILTGDFNEGFKMAFNPVNIGSALILGGLEGARQIPNNTKVPVEAIRQNQPLLEPLQLNSIPLRTLPQNVVIPPAPVFIPQRTVIPQKYNYNITNNKYKG